MSAIGRTIAHGLLVAVGSLVLSGCFETEYGPLLAGRPHYELIHLKESYDAVCAIPSTAVIDTSLEPHSEHRRNMLDYSIDEEGREVVRNHTHEAYGLSDFHAERQPDYDDERGEAWLTFIHGEHVQVPPEGEDFWIAYRHGRDCLADNNIMLFPYTVEPEPSPLQLVSVPIVVDGVVPKISNLMRADTYKSVMEVFPVSEIWMRNQDSSDEDLRINVPPDSPAVFQNDAGEWRLDTDALYSPDEDWSTAVSDTTLKTLRETHRNVGEIFVGHIDRLHDAHMERYGEYGLRMTFALGGHGLVVVSSDHPAWTRWPDDPSYLKERIQFTGLMAHELGHAMSLWHAPCGSAGRTDPDFPHPDGSVGNGVLWGETRNREGATGYITEPLMSKDTGYNDLMGYCPNNSIAPYHFKRVLVWQRTGRWAAEGCAGPQECGQNAHPTGSMMLVGHVNSAGVPVLTYAAESPLPPYDDLGGGFSVRVFSEDGVHERAAQFKAYPFFAGDEQSNHLWSIRVPRLESVGAVQISSRDGLVLSEARLEANAFAQRRYRVIAH